jgi:Aldo/keto reductase family
MAVTKRELGRTGLQVTTLGYGAMELRGAPRARDITETQAETILNKVLDAGINYIDTSIDYGLSEERIGRYISHRRSEYYLASKCGCLVGAPPAPRGQRGQHVFTRENVVAGVEQSLVRMKTDYLDVVQFHSSPSRQTLEEHGALEVVLEPSGPDAGLQLSVFGGRGRRLADIGRGRHELVEGMWRTADGVVVMCGYSATGRRSPLSSYETCHKAPFGPLTLRSG